VVKSQQGQAREADVHPALDLEVFRQMADMSNDAFYLCDEQGRFLYVNDSSMSSIGYTRDELLTMRVSDIAPDFPPDRMAEFVANLRHGPVAPFETRNRHKNGTMVPIEISVAHLEIEGADYMFVVRDISERKQLETSRKSFTQRMLRTLEAERQRIARELHDDVGQSVATVGVLLHALEQTPGSVAEEVRPALAQTHASIRQITESVARIVRDYHPAEPRARPRGHTALARRPVHSTSPSGARARDHLDGGPPRPRAGAPPLSHRAGSAHQHARHAHARRVVVRLKRQHGELVLTVRDDGIGFTPETSRASGGLGLVTMQERAELMHATLTLESTARHGTEVRIAIPVDAVRAARPTAVLVSATPVVETPDGETTAADRRLTVLERPRR
jgi:PAS domain S-box-containing protein